MTLLNFDSKNTKKYSLSLSLNPPLIAMDMTQRSLSDGIRYFRILEKSAARLLRLLDHSVLSSISSMELTGEDTISRDKIRYSTPSAYQRHNVWMSINLPEAEVPCSSCCIPESPTGVIECQRTTSSRLRLRGSGGQAILSSIPFHPHAGTSNKMG
jgi:hypothetical protein